MDIIVTGASRGIGFEVVKAFASLPDMNIIVLARNRENLERLKKVCEPFPSGKRVQAFPADLTQYERVSSEIIPFIYKEFNKLDILVNNAGYLINKPFEEIQTDELEKMLNVNFKVPFMLIQSLSDLLKKADKPHVINISSMGGVQGSVKFPGLAAYSSAKGALAVLTECLAEEYRELGIFFNCLALGAVQTEMLEEAFPGYHALMEKEEIARFIADFALTGHKFFNGKILPVSISIP